MNKKQAIKKSIKVWEHLRNNPQCTKSAAYEALGFLKGKVDENYCALCQYTIERNSELTGTKVSPWAEPNCILCPVWPTPGCPGGTGCEHETSPYNKWRKAERVTDPSEQWRKKKKYAGQMVVILKHALHVVRMEEEE